jgi:hypothetical protein
VGEYRSALDAGLECKNGWTLAERAGEVSPYGMQRLLRPLTEISAGCVMTCRTTLSSS